MKTMHLFAGAGGGLLCDLILGHIPVVAVEWDAYCCQILRERAADGWFPGLHVHEGDIRLFEPSDYAGRVDIVHAGFPCQDLSNAGNRAGLGEGTRSGLYREVLRIAGVVRPRYLFLENVSAILRTKEKILATVCGWAREPGYLFNASNLREKRGFLSRVFEIANSVAVGIVLGDLAARGYDCRWTCLPASATGAPHYRDRWWCLAERADAESARLAQRRSSGLSTVSPEESARMVHGSERHGEDVSDAAGERCREAGQLRCNEPEERITGDGETVADADLPLRSRLRIGAQTQDAESGCSSEDVADTHSDSGEQGGLGWWSVEPDVGRVDHGVAARVDRIKALGNGQVPLQAALAWRMLTT